ncbi:SpoIIE family protein phosphatase [Motilibacter deserti]|uniref:SpoIIE family protein phosphatase n=1 Tax=Motilibacter deserti TaxID=2714956 RepID=A0ABX0GWR9_9ACTN|nr:SpoIIE family protein phosphatase [Motilibacter deserti]NHC15386.1 SpoIIE family protein phosphatase [Motilibacter deserti]
MTGGPARTGGEEPAEPTEPSGPTRPADPPPPEPSPDGSELAGLAALHAAYQRERAGREDAERAVRSAAVLQAVTGALSGAHDMTAVAEVVSRVARTGVGAAGSFVARLHRSGGRFELLGTDGLSGPTAQAWRSMPADRDLPPGEALLTRSPVLVRTRAERDARFPRIMAGPNDDPGSFAALPLLDAGSVVGVVNFSWRQEGQIDVVGVELLTALAAQCAQALERARLYEAERAARQRAEEAVERLRVLQSLTARLSGAVDGASVGAVILSSAMTALDARGGVVYRLDERRGTLSPLASRGRSGPQPGPALPVAASGPIARALRLGAPVVAGADPEQVCIPLVLEARQVGVLCLDVPDGTAVAVEDRAFLDAVAGICAQALERAELFDRAHDTATTLQRSMLPRRPPAVPGLEVAVRYRPVGGRTWVGGDFYDVFALGPGRWGVVIGDVSGKGVEAAALTAVARYTVRAVAPAAVSPAQVLAQLNAAVLDWADGEDRFCTVAYLEVRPGPPARVSLAVGGHPLPTLVPAQGGVRPVGVAGTAIGLVAGATSADVDVDLAPGEALVLVTDGALEARRPDGSWADDLVTRVLSTPGPTGAPAGRDAEEIADRVERAVLDVQAGLPRDDLAVVVLRVPDASEPRPATLAMTLECAPESVARARRRTREFVAAATARTDPDADAAEVAALLVSEVVTNAVVHARTSAGLRIELADDRARIEVGDASPLAPVRREADSDELGGRGLLLLDRLAAAWGVEQSAEGKVVWFEVDLECPEPDAA